MEKKKYYPEIDICKGIGILFVVLGHALKQTGETNQIFTILLSVIYSFHMPLFFVLSGFVSGKILRMSGGKEKTAYMKERAFRLLIPYFVVGLLYVPLKFYLSKFTVKPYDFASLWKVFLGDNPNTALWFLYILFWVIVISTLLVSARTLYLFTMIAFLLSAASFIWDWQIRIPRYWFFFLLGMVLNRHYGVLQKKLRAWWMMGGMMILFGLSNLFLYLNDWSWCQIITSLTGIALCFGLAGILHGTGAGKLLMVPGKYNMDVYIISEPVNTVVKLLFWNILHLNYIAVTGICFLAAFLLPLPISLFIVRKIKVFRIGILGMH